MPKLKQRGARRRVTQKKSPSISANLQRLAINSNLNLTEPSMYKLDATPVKVNRQAIYQMDRSYTGPQIPISVASASFGVITPSLSLVPDFTEFTNLFDQYRVTQVIIQFIPQAGMGSLDSFPQFYTVIDLADITPLVGINQALEYNSLRTIANGHYFERIWTPVTLASGSGSDVFPKAMRWITKDDAGATLQLGLKWALPAGAVGVGVYNTNIRLVMQFRMTQ